MKKTDSAVFRKIKLFAKDSLWSVLALVLVNCASQFLIYPLWAVAFGAEKYGNILYVMGLVNTFAVSIGVACNYARMAEASRRKTQNGDYNVILLLLGVLVVAISFLLAFFGKARMNLMESAFSAGLAVLIMWRYYADVEYRLTLDYKGYFTYYFIISVGYLLGVLLFRQTKMWPLALIPGEFFGLVRVALKGSLFKAGALRNSDAFKRNCNSALVLIATNLISNAIFNGDRILLQVFLNGSAVTVYYLASLAGKTMSLVTTPLNSVIIGYLSRFQGEFSRKMIHIFTAITLAAIVAGTIFAVAVSHILIQVLYSENYLGVKGYFVIANFTQTVYFVTNIVMVLMLRIVKTNRQLIVNAIYAVAFFAFGIPAVLWSGIPGFCYAVLAANIIRYVVAIAFCYTSIG